MTPTYFSDKDKAPRARTEEEIGNSAWGGIIAAINSRLADGSFGCQFPETCPDGSVCCGVDDQSFRLGAAGEIPEVSWPLDVYTQPPTLAILDLIEFSYRAVGKPNQVGYHSYYKHNHLAFNREEGQENFRDNINTIFARNRIAYELEEDGSIERLAPAIIGEALGSAIFRTRDAALDQMLETARQKFLDPDPEVRIEALEKLWDAFERVKTLEIPGEKNKKASAAQLLNKAAGEPRFLQELEVEALALTKIGNDFQIRHSETYKTPLTYSQHVDYLFHRLFSFIGLLLRMTGRGG